MGAKNNESRFRESVQVCPDWTAITREFDRLPKPVLRQDEEGEFFHQGWIFRGHKKESYSLAPSIERAYPYCDWSLAEFRILREFQSKARMHLDPAQVPQTDYRLGWLAIMQHYGAPTRLLDFTYSPYVALYFALRNREKNESNFAEVWGFDATALRNQTAKISGEADRKVREKTGKPHKGGRVGSLAEDAASPLQRAQEETNSGTR
jgi:hypothetical protein